MKIYTGIDILEIERFKKAFKGYGDRFLNKIFSPEEIQNFKGDILKMCISFSFKESIWKSLPDEIQKNFYFKDMKILWQGNNPLFISKIENFNFLLSYTLNEKYVITLVLVYH